MCNQTSKTAQLVARSYIQLLLDKLEKNRENHILEAANFKTVILVSAE